MDADVHLEQPTEAEAAAAREVIRRYLEAQRTLQSAREAGDRIRATFDGIGSAVSRSPERLHFEGAVVTVLEANGTTRAQQFPLEDLDLERLRSLAKQAQGAHATIVELAPRMREIGLLGPERTEPPSVASPPTTPRRARRR